MVIVFGCLVLIDFICCIYIYILDQILNWMDAKILLNISDARCYVIQQFNTSAAQGAAG